MSAWSRFATLDAVLLGVLALGTCLPFGDDGGEGLWSADLSSKSVSTTMAVLLLFVVLLWGALATAGAHAPSVAQLLVGLLTALSVGTQRDLGPGGSLIVTTALLSAAAGAVAELTAWREHGRRAA
ncbi:hypothetical protein [Nocardioides sp. 503]|uniref:hypothetical protein n=1 Tax=Nocardioides sp. 503 TaxID=2508326 RepID=UPI00106F0A5D|nr:hypothetical protein [Nocardioides sp. 503]